MHYRKFFIPGFFFFLLLGQMSISSCTKTTTKTITVTDTVTKIVKDTVVVYPIQGLWVGTYTNTSTGVTYYFSFTVYPDNTLSYKSGGANNTTFFATGTWTLTGTTFSFSVVEKSTGDTQTGSAVYSLANGTLTNGTVTDATTGLSGTWSMNKIN